MKTLRQHTPTGPDVHTDLSRHRFHPHLKPTSGQDSRKKRAIAYLITRFPSFSETFILREITGLRDTGIELSLFSLKSRPQGIMHKEAVAFIEQTQYAPYFSLKVLKSNVRTALGRPRRYVSTLWYLFRHEYKNPYTLIRTFGILPKAVHFGRIMEREGIDHLHAHWATFAATGALAISRIFDIPFSFTGHAHDVKGEYAEGVNKRTTTMHEKVKHAVFVLSCSKDVRNYIAENHANGDSAKVILNYHGIDVDRFNHQRNSMKEPVRILSVGRLVDYKGFPYVITACSLLREKGIRFECDIVGEGPEHLRLQNMIDRAGLSDCVRLCGALTQGELIELYKESDFFVFAPLPGFHFGLPNVILEAMAMRLVPVVAGLPTVPEAIEHGVDGFIVPEKDAGAIADTLLMLMSETELSDRIREKAREKIVRRFDISRNVGELAQIFLERTNRRNAEHPAEGTRR
jgi:glycosyltransferase involved in cell wall biosynthesis